MTEHQAQGYGDLPGLHVNVNQIVALNVARFRKAAGLTQEELGERLGGWSKNTISALERSWDGKRPRQFDADTMLGLALALEIPLAALLLPPEDDGVRVRYEFHAADSDACSSMHDLMYSVLSDPTDADTPAMEAYRQRYAAALNAYIDADRGEGMAGVLDDLTEERITERLARLRDQYEALRSVLLDLDGLQGSLEDRRAELRQHRGRP